jgi:hypothetical protein
LRKRRRPALSFANVVSCLALLVALGGGAYAATQLPKNSVGPRQLRKNSVNTKKVKNHSLRAVDFKAGQLPAGAPGPPGPQGPGAVKLYFDAGNDDQLVQLGEIGPWTVSAQCIKGGAVVPAPLKVFIDGPGFADAGYNSKFNLEPAAADVAHLDLTNENELFSLGVKGTDVFRLVGTIVLRAGADAPVVSIPFTAVEDGVNSHCSFMGTATPAG